MDLIEPKLSDMSDQVINDAEARQRAAAESPHTLKDQKKAEETGAREKVEGAGEKRDLPGDDEDTPPGLPAAQVGKTPGVPLRPPLTPRKNIIPSRRTTFDAAWTPSASKKSASPPDGMPTEKIDPPTATPATPFETATSETSQPQSGVTDPPDAADQPTRSDLPAAGSPASLQVDLSARSDPPAANSQTDTSAYADLSIMYHDTSAAEEAWRAVTQEDEFSQQDTHILAVAARTWTDDEQHVDRQPTAEMNQQETVAALTTQSMAPVTPLPPTLSTPVKPSPFIDIPTTPMPVLEPVKPPERQHRPLTRKKALLMMLLLTILLINALAASFNQSFGTQGWASVWDNQPGSNQNLLTQIAQQLLHSPTPGGSKATAIPSPTPTQIVNLIMSNMTLDEKLGQMMMIQFTGPDYSPQLDAMISQYKVGSVLVFAANGNIVSKSQVKGLVSQMQKNAFLPLSISIDQEGGTVDRLIGLDGPQPAAATIGATGDTHKAYQQGLKDAKDLSAYGFNLNLAPVVDVTNVYNSQLYNRTYGNNATIVTSMAGAYLQGLQKSGKVLGTLKHFPGLGDVSVDPHFRPPDLIRSLSGLNSIDWAPYTALIKQGNVYAVMVTHEYVKALDTSEPSSLSPKVIGILRNQMHFQGVIMTDSLTMDSISNYYNYGQAAAMAVKAGDDLLMGASSPNDLATMLKGIKQAIAAGEISQQQIDDSVRRDLLLKYEMGLIHV